MTRPKSHFHDEQGRCVLVVSENSQNGGMAQVVGGHLFRRFLAGDREFVIRLPGNITLATIEVICGAMLAFKSSIELEGPGAARVEEYLEQQHSHQI